MRYEIAVIVCACCLACCPGSRAGEPFTQESAILAVSREDQANALKTRLLKKEVVLSEIIAVLTNFKVVTADQYLTYDHQISGVRGTVTLKGNKTYTFEIEPGYAAQVKDARGETTYLLAPNLKVEPAAAPGGKKAGAAPRIPTEKEITQFAADPIRPDPGNHFKNFKIDKADLLKILSSYHVIPEQDWRNGYSHVAFGDRTGTITLRDGNKIQYMVRPGGLATLTFPDGQKLFLAAEITKRK
jgi:hypothetical protein